jgi:DNA polymerase III epsilon subunit-like protein
LVKPFICGFDLETTGLPAEADYIGIVQLAAIMIDPNLPGWPEVGRFASYLRLQPGVYKSPFAMRMHRDRGKSETFFAARGGEPASVYHQFERFLKPFGEVVLAGHNAGPFDVPLLARDMRRCGFDLTDGKPGGGRLADHHIIDTASMAFDRFGCIGSGELSKVSLKPLAEFLGFAFDAEKAHEAVYDVEVMLYCLRKMKNII